MDFFCCERPKRLHSLDFLCVWVMNSQIRSQTTQNIKNFKITFPMKMYILFEKSRYHSIIGKMTFKSKNSLNHYQTFLCAYTSRFIVSFKHGHRKEEKCLFRAGSVGVINGGIILIMSCN